MLFQKTIFNFYIYFSWLIDRWLRKRPEKILWILILIWNKILDEIDDDDDDFGFNLKYFLLSLSLLLHQPTKPNKTNYNLSYDDFPGPFLFSISLVAVLYMVNLLFLSHFFFNEQYLYFCWRYFFSSHNHQQYIFDVYTCREYSIFYIFAKMKYWFPSSIIIIIIMYIKCIKTDYHHYFFQINNKQQSKKERKIPNKKLSHTERLYIHWIHSYMKNIKIRMSNICLNIHHYLLSS